jgi:hypothetical protein
MDVKDFVSEILRQVTEGIEENKSTLDTDGRSISNLKDLNMFSFNGGWVTHVDFDIAITESKSRDGGAKLSIAGVGNLGGDLSEGTETASRVKFRVPLLIKSKAVE